MWSAVTPSAVVHKSTTSPRVISLRPPCLFSDKEYGLSFSSVCTGDLHIETGYEHADATHNKPNTGAHNTLEDRANAATSQPMHQRRLALYSDGKAHNSCCAQVALKPAPCAPTLHGSYFSLQQGVEKKRTLRRMFDWRQALRRVTYFTVKHHQLELVSWICLLLCVYGGYLFFSDGGFSAILTLASVFQCFSLILLHIKWHSQANISGISQRSLFLLIISLAFRLCSTLFYNGYLPMDRSGDWAYQVADITTTVLGLLFLGLTRWNGKKFGYAQAFENDTCWIALPLLCAALLAVFVHPTLNQNAFADICWTFSLYVETFSMVPQLFIMGKAGGEVEGLTSHYVASMALSRLLAFVFWFFTYTELSPRGSGRNVAGGAVMLSYSGQTLLFLDFLYYYIKALRKGENMTIQV